MKTVLENLRNKNPEYTIHDIRDASFHPYGIVHEYTMGDLLPLLDEMIQVPSTGNAYQPSVAALEDIELIQRISLDIYGGLAVEAGSCTGNNAVLNGLEYHQGSETILAVKDFVLIVGKRQDMVGNTYNGELCECFYVPAGTVVECFATTLHYTPCKVDDTGFKTVVLLPKGTNEPMEGLPKGILMRTNKWFIAHVDNTAKIEAGNYPGLTGKMIEIKY